MSIIPLYPTEVHPFPAMVASVLRRLSSDASKSQYLYTYRDWLRFCNEHGIDPLSDLTATTVYAYLLAGRKADGLPVTYQTRKNKCAHLRKLMTVMLEKDRGELRDTAAELFAMQVPYTNANPAEREKSALDADQIQAIFSVWINGNRLLAKRNLAVLSLAIATGMRISEMCALRWSDVDMRHHSIHVRHGKGDKSRHVAIIDGLHAHQYLHDWRIASGWDCTYVFRPIRSNDTMGDDKPVRPITIQKMVEVTREKAGTHFTFHWGRYTMATEALAAGASPADVMAQGGWTDAKTMLDHYAKAASVRKRRERLKVNWGVFEDDST